jgi:hypothetical protein
MEAVRRDLEEQIARMDALDRRHAATMEAWNELRAKPVVDGFEEKQRHEERWTYHRRAMKEFDDKLNGLIAWLDDFVKRNPKNGK